MGTEKIRRYIERLTPAGICDDCLTSAAGLERRSEARAQARELIGAEGFVRCIGKCCMCNASKTLTKKSR